MNICRQITTYKFVRQQIKENPSAIVRDSAYQLAWSSSGVTYYEHYSIGNDIRVIKETSRLGLTRHRLCATNGSPTQCTGSFAKMIYDMMHNAYVQQQNKAKQNNR